MKKFVAGLLAFTLILSLAGCGVTEKLEEKAGEALAENIIEKAGGGDVDIDGDTVIIKGESGEELTFGANEWPTSELAKSIPEFKAGEITAILDSDASVMVTLESVKEADFSAYLETIKKDFTEDPYEATTDGNISYGAQNAAGDSIALQYGQESLTILLTKAEE